MSARIGKGCGIAAILFTATTARPRRPYRERPDPLIAQGRYDVDHRRRNAGETRFADPDPKGEAMETPRARLPPSASQGPGGIHEIEDMGIRRRCTDAG